MSAQSFAANVKIDQAYQFVDNWYGTLEIGYRSLRSGEATYAGNSASAGGSGIFIRDGALRKVSIDLSGFFASFGVSYSF